MRVLSSVSVQSHTLLRSPSDHTTCAAPHCTTLKAVPRVHTDTLCCMAHQHTDRYSTGNAFCAFVVNIVCKASLLAHCVDLVFLLLCCCDGGGVGVVRGVRQHGMPVHKHPDLKGNLYVEFEFDFPESLDCETAEVSITLS